MYPADKEEPIRYGFYDENTNTFYELTCSWEEFTEWAAKVQI